MFGGWHNTASAILRNGEVVKQTRRHTIPARSNIHRRWFYIRAEKRGGELSYYVDGQRVLAHTLDTLLRLLHPMIPFLTEEVWQLLGEVAPRRGIDECRAAAASIMVAAWPQSEVTRQDPEIEAQFAQFKEVLRAVREIRSRQNVAPKKRLEFAVRCGEEMAELLRPMEPYFVAMAGARPTG